MKRSPSPAVKAVLVLFALLALTLLPGACKRGKAVLHIYTWADYIKPDLVARFEADHACQVVVDTFDSNEAMYAKLKAGAGGYDIITPTTYMVSVMTRQNMLQQLDQARLPNLVHVDRELLALSGDTGMKYGVPYMMGYTGIAYLKSRVTGFVPSWAMFDRADLKGRMTLFDDMRETIGAALKFLGCSINTRDPGELERAKAVVIRWKKNLAKFENEQYKSGIASGEFLLVHSYNGDIAQVQKENADVAFAAPLEGTVMSCDVLVIPRGAAQVALAHAFIDFLHTPAVAAENSEFIGYLCPNRPSYDLLSAEFRGNATVFLNEEVKAKSEMFQDLGDDNALYVKIWDQIKAAQ
jgi:spermidine/putrescine transport system substrate-binding protein